MLNGAKKRLANVVSSFIILLQGDVIEIEHEEDNMI